MSTQKSSFRKHVVIFAVISCCIMVVPVALFALPLVDRYRETPPPVSTNPLDLSPEVLYGIIAPSVVTIIVNDESEEPIASGSGFFVDEAFLGERYEWLKSDKFLAGSDDEDSKGPTHHGYVLTNYHVIRPAVYANVHLFNGDKGKVCHVIGEDESADLALLSVNVWSERPLQPIPLATSNPRILSTVYAIGSPEGLQGTASQGKVSAYRAISGSDLWLQTTAPISSGSSGGPLVSTKGELVGVTTMTQKEGQNLNFAIPVSIVRSFFWATNFNLRRRDVAEGANIKWHEEKAFLQVLAAAASPRFTDSQCEALELLDEARKELLSGELIKENRKERDARYHQAIANADAAYTSLPDEFKYVAHYIAGKSYRGLAPPKWTGIEFRRDSKHYRVALENLLQVTSLNPTFSPGWWGLAHQGNISKSKRLQALDKLAELMPRCADVMLMRAKWLQPKAAVRGMRDSIELSPRNGWLHFQLAAKLSEMGEHVEAISSYEAALTLWENQSTKNLIQYEIGRSHMKSGNMEKATLAFAKAKAMGLQGATTPPGVTTTTAHNLSPIDDPNMPFSLRIQAGSGSAQNTQQARNILADGSYKSEAHKRRLEKIISVWEVAESARLKSLVANDTNYRKRLQTLSDIQHKNLVKAGASASNPMTMQEFDQAAKEIQRNSLAGLSNAQHYTDP